MKRDKLNSNVRKYQDVAIISSFNSNELHLNTNKSTYIAFHTNQTQCTLDIPIVIENTHVFQSNTTNLFTINIDETFEWLPNIQFISTKIAKTISILRRLSKYVSTKILLILYNKYIAISNTLLHYTGIHISVT